MQSTVPRRPPDKGGLDPPLPSNTAGRYGLHPALVVCPRTLEILPEGRIACRQIAILAPAPAYPRAPTQVRPKDTPTADQESRRAQKYLDLDDVPAHKVP